MLSKLKEGGPVETCRRKKAVREQPNLNMAHAPVKSCASGLYRLDGAIGRIWELLSDQEWHSVRDLEIMFDPVNVRGRLRIIKLHGPAPVVPKDKTWSKTCNWRIEESSDHLQVRMCLSPL